MAIKARTLARLIQANSLLRALPKGDFAPLVTELLGDLKIAHDLIKRGLPSAAYNEYADIFQGVIAALEQTLSNMDMGALAEVFGLSLDLVTHTTDRIEKDGRFKKEIVFLPYKSSMWDSMESVWKAAKADQDHAIPYVIPIPYADRNEDGSPGELHYEIQEYPDYVETIDHRTISLKELRPDTIVIHNPYDGYNKVTVVPEEYYSDRLKTYTDKLVYIPYYILEDPTPGDEEQEEQLANYVLKPGVYNADLVCVQSEAMREAYINILTRYTNKKDRSYWEPKIAATGSPKVDKVLTSKKEDFTLPEKWQKLIGNKKVILYNTTVTAFGEHQEKYLAKMRSVFATFKGRDDVALWWRPHPLMKATAHTIGGKLEREYLALVEEYIAEGWGIYDDTADLHRAICWSDGYYGDMSSVVGLVREAGKPVMVQNVEILTGLFD